MTTQVKSSNLANNITINIASSGAITTTNFTIQESGGKLVIKYGSNTVFSIDSTGVITANTSFVAGGTP
jgi:hypothetical protein